MKILHVTSHSLTRLTPARIAAYWGRYTGHSGVGICTGRGGGKAHHREPLNPYGVFFSRGHDKELKRLVEEADVIHCHDDAYPTNLTGDIGKRMIYMAHIGDVPKRIFRTGRFKYNKHVSHVAITNGYGRHFDEEQKRAKIPWGRLPDILDLEHPTYQPNEVLRAANPKFTVTFTYSNRHEPGRKINAKCPRATAALLTQLPKFGIDVDICTGMAFEEAMARKQRAHVVLDELFSPYTHLSCLEGAAVAACPLVSFDDYTRNELCDFLGAPRSSYPFVNVTPQNVADTITALSRDPRGTAEAGLAARRWMEDYYHPRTLLGYYEELYEKRP